MRLVHDFGFRIRTTGNTGNTGIEEIENMICPGVSEKAEKPVYPWAPRVPRGCFSRATLADHAVDLCANLVEFFAQDSVPFDRIASDLLIDVSSHPSQISYVSL